MKSCNPDASTNEDKYRRRRGPVFADRYHVEVITSPKRARYALSYVLNNWRKHEEDQQGLPSTWLVDPFSSGILFPDWQELDDKDLMWPIRQTYDPLVVYRPRTWLLREGWKIHGSISAREANQSFSRVLSEAEHGDTIVITRRGKPVAVLAPYASRQSPERAQAIERLVELMRKGLPLGGRRYTRDEMHER